LISNKDLLITKRERHPSTQAQQRLHCHHDLLTPKCATFLFFDDVEPHQGRGPFGPTLEEWAIDTRPHMPKPCIR